MGEDLGPLAALLVPSSRLVPLAREAVLVLVLSLPRAQLVRRGGAQRGQLHRGPLLAHKGEGEGGEAGGELRRVEDLLVA